MNLKPAALQSDSPGMFSTIASPPRGPRTELRVLRLSLNTPVVAIEDLPVGPAAAGVALHRGPEGTQLTLAVRSVRTGQVVFFRPDEEWSEFHGSELALDAALSFAESMGFLFDDDLVAAGGDARETARRWSELMEEVALDGYDELPDGELWLEDVATAPPAALLTKFRFLAEVLPESRSAGAPGTRGAPRWDLWVRLLSRL
jgi:hypothetical protein